MHGLPTTFDPHFIKGKEVESILFAAYQVNLYFSNNVRIQIEGSYKLYCGNEELESVKTFPVLNSSLLRLIGKKTLDVLFTPSSGNIEIKFEDTMRLLIDGEVGPYESYRLFDGRNEIIV